MPGVFFIFALLTITRVGGTKFDQSVVNYYVDLIENRTNAALTYEFPEDAREHEAADVTIREYGYYDFILIGAGSAGCVIANRLSEISEWKILVLEAGTFSDSDLTEIPSLWVVDMCTKFNWGFKTVPQKYGCLGNDGNRCNLFRGKGYGGGSLINAMVYSRGEREDFQRISELLEDSSWNYENLLPYFKKSEHFLFTKSSPPIDVKYHGFHGPLPVTHATPALNTTSIFLNGSEELGYNLTDYNGRQMLGSAVFQLHTKFGRRYDNSRAFIDPIKTRENVTLLDWSYVTKIVINSTTQQATGVIFTRHNKTYIARSRKEVILSAGVISSPQILLLSGVGPKEDLQSVGVPVVQNLPVGKNLRDHTYTVLIFSTNITQTPESVEESVQDLLNGKGSLTRSFPYDVVNWFRTELTMNYTNMEIYFANITSTPLIKTLFGWSNETYEAFTPNVPNPIALVIDQLHPKSAGAVKLNSSDPFEYPLIDPNVLSVESDVEQIYDMIQLTLNLTQTKAFRSLNFKLASDQLPACKHIEPMSKDYWYCYIKNTLALAIHPAGTCKTAKSPEIGVVDNKLNVFGIKGLRVADGGVLPYTLSAHNHAACTMVGEKASDIIKKDYGF